MTTVLIVIACGLMLLNMAEKKRYRRERREQARREDLLINQILHLSGRTWTPPPADEWQPPVEGEPLVREWTTQPEQQPYA